MFGRKVRFQMCRHSSAQGVIVGENWYDQAIIKFTRPYFAQDEKFDVGDQIVLDKDKLTVLEPQACGAD